MSKPSSIPLLFLLAACGGAASKDGTSTATGGSDTATEHVDSTADSGDTDSAFTLAVGQPAPDFTLPDADGNLVSLSDFRGSRVIVMGTAEWCGYCQSLTEKMQEWYTHAAAPDQLVISALIEDSTGATATIETAAQWRERYSLTFPVLADVDGQWRSAYSIEGDAPQRTYVVVDSSGVITFLQADGSPIRRGDLVDAVNAAD